MNNPRLCHRWGLLVDGKNSMLEHPAEYRCAFFGKLGCHRLHCSGCGAIVRAGVPGAMPRYSIGEYALSRPQIEQLFLTEDWLSLPFIEQQAGGFGRLYACKCQCSEQFTVDYVSGHGNYAPDDDSDPRRPWSCDGHPLPELPITIGELPIGDDCDPTELVARIFAGATLRPLGTKYEGPALAISWLYAFLLGLPLGERIAIATADLLDADRGKHAHDIATFYTRFPRASGVERILAAIERRFGELAEAKDTPGDILSLWRVVEARLSEQLPARDATDARAWELFGRALLSSEVSSATDQKLRAAFGRRAGVFDEAELRWFTDQSAAIEKAGHGRWPALLGLLAASAKLDPTQGHFVVIAGLSLQREGRATADQLRTWTREWIEENGRETTEWELPLTSGLASRLAGASA